MHVAAEAVKQQYQQADIFLFPSQWEGSPKVLMEAAASGLPVIARNNYQPETVVDGETGYLVGSDEELFVRLRELLANRGATPKVGRGWPQGTACIFDWDRITRRWEEIFLDLVSRKTARAA